MKQQYFTIAVFPTLAKNINDVCLHLHLHPLAFAAHQTSQSFYIA